MFDDAKWKMLNDNWNAKKAATAKAAIANNQIVFSDASNSGRKQKSFLEDQISTGGSIGGALAGGAAGTAVLPGVGTLIGAVLGGALGGGGGQIVENAVTGEEDLTQDVGSEALWGGATSLPMGAYLKFAKAGGALVKGGGSAVAKNEAMNLINQAAVKTMPKRTLESAIQNSTFSPAMTDAVVKVAETPSLFQKLGGKLSGTADDLAVKQFRFAPKQITELNKVLGEDVGSYVRKKGFNTVDDIATKGIDPLQSEYDNIISSMTSVPKATVKQGFDNAIKKLNSSPMLDKKALAERLQQQTDAILSQVSDNLSGDDLLKLRREFDAGVKRNAFGSAEQNLNKESADTLRTILQSAADSAGLKTSTGSTLKDVGLELSKLRTLEDAALSKENLGRGNLPLSLMQLLSSGAGGVVGGVPGALSGAAVSAAVNSKAGRTALMGVADKTVNGLSNNGQKAIGQTLKQATMRIGGIDVSRNLISNQSSDLNMAGNTTSAQNTISAPAIAPPMTSNMNTQYTQNSQASSPFGVSSEELGQAMVRAMFSGDTKGFTQLKQLYDITSDYEKSQQPKSKAMGVEAVKNMNNAAAGLTAINDLESMINQDSGVVSRAAVPDIAPLNGLLGTSRYRAAIKDAQDTLSRLRSGASMTEQESKRFDQMLPRVGDDPATIQYKINRFREYYNSFINNPAMAQPTPVSPVGM